MQAVTTSPRYIRWVAPYIPPLCGFGSHVVVVKRPISEGFLSTASSALRHVIHFGPSLCSLSPRPQSQTESRLTVLSSIPTVAKVIFRHTPIFGLSIPGEFNGQWPVNGHILDNIPSTQHSDSSTLSEIVLRPTRLTHSAATIARPRTRGGGSGCRWVLSGSYATLRGKRCASENRFTPRSSRAGVSERRQHGPADDSAVFYE